MCLDLSHRHARPWKVGVEEAVGRYNWELVASHWAGTWGMAVGVVVAPLLVPAGQIVLAQEAKGDQDASVPGLRRYRRA